MLVLEMNVGVDHLRDVFGHMGLSDKDIVALSGGHTLVSIQYSTASITMKFLFAFSFTERI